MTLASPTFEDGRAMLIAGLGGRYTYESGAQQIPLLWLRFAAHIGKVPGEVMGVAYGVCHDFHKDNSFEYIAGVEVETLDGLPATFARLSIPARRYAVFTHRGHITGLRATLEEIWQRAVPASGLKVAEAPTFERYGPAFNPMTGLGEVEIRVPLEA